MKCYKCLSYQLSWYYCLLIHYLTEDILNELYKYLKFMSNQNKQNHKRQERNNTEWLDELINKIENMKNKISNTY